jgi:hypothetical protein
MTRLVPDIASVQTHHHGGFARRLGLPMSTTATATLGDDSPHAPRGSIGVLALSALEVVYGDIGTRPLYTLKTALEWGGGATPEVATVHLMDNFHSMVVHYGFMDQPDIPQLLDARGSQQMQFDLTDTSLFRRPDDDCCGCGIAMEPDQHQLVQGDAPQRLAGDRILPHPAQPRDRARRPSKNLSGI